jgi:type I restriction enzyme S subunit
MSAGGAAPRVTIKQVRCLEVTRPPLGLQRRFAAIVVSVEKQKARMRAHLAELDTLFASLPFRAFNGSCDRP